MKKILLLCLVAVSAFVCRAAYSHVVLHMTDGTSTEIVLCDDLELSFTDTELVAKGGGADVTVARKQIDKVTHTYTSAVEDAMAAASFSFSGNTLRFGNLPAGTIVNVFSAAGALVRTADAEGDFELSLDDLTAGAYVVSANGMSYKVIVK